jgi:GDP-4-dehydro-6-deoxy-D-mannose reductase
MRIVLFGSGGFLGSAVCRELLKAGNELFDGLSPVDGARVNLLDQQEIEEYLELCQPEVIISCAGVVGGGEYSQNIVFTRNIIEASAATKLKLRRVIITGSAAEYGTVESLPVDEEVQLNAATPYGLSKIEEEKTALKLGANYKIPILIIRLFNPIGVGMASKFLLPSLKGQINKIILGQQDAITMSRLDSERDYVDVKDVAIAYRMLCEGVAKHNVYNVGSGVGTTNTEILRLMLKYSKINNQPSIFESSDIPEPLVASRANISRIKSDFGWDPKQSLEITIKEIMNES